eukprot:CAMPEP_0198359668 /NCGR_PEP_ID=MMETSP1450-20131203/135511_1 /TAXON_ID=753684 ORGANISM="Madagascaria erythrocladiodes, Strain CCMP3234" /NCGR_SAMPLE_ID=MMETSP1450 /ASSEMBLY_ACC=CAM_ASM_001115 /LENGTH=56 /DNA_ID=CAMNT_0044066571 /DNA_START=1 /DNA_END=167 /DNA_ORIENTATION=-
MNVAVVAVPARARVVVMCNGGRAARRRRRGGAHCRRAVRYVDGAAGVARGVGVGAR